MDKTYDHSSAERSMQQAWEQEKTYSFERTGKPLFSVDTPPPTASGALHIGHIFSYTHADIVVRYKRMSGYDIFYPFGVDDNGLATERFVEKKREILGYQMARSEFIAICLTESHEIGKQFKALWQRMGLSVDWEQSYSTIDDRSRCITQTSFLQLYNKEYVYRRDEPALYCTTCRTAVAQAELDDAQQQSVFYDIRFSGDANDALVISTTRPELLSSCVALLYNPQDTRYSQLQGKQATVPLFDYSVPILADDQVVMEKGTGLVMCCTFGDTTDIAWYRKFNLPYRPSIGQDGRWMPSTGILAGLKGKQARETIIAALTQSGHLIDQKPTIHSVSVHERCKQSIDFLILKQWFLKLLPYKKQLLACADQIQWHPAFMKARYVDWVEHIHWDWCLSRQRFYGVPFPVWHCTDCGHVICAREDQLPIDPQEVAYQGTCPACKGSNIKPDTDVMDTWNTSSLTQYICTALMRGTTDGLFEKPYESLSVRPHAHDIIRTWTFYSIVKSWMHNQTVPWKELMISGHVLSSDREKLSKSKENSPLKPENLLTAHPADAVRYWTASGTLGHDVAFSEGQLKVGNRLLVKLWNACLFIKERTQGIDLNEKKIAERGAINEWILHRASECFEKYQAALQMYEFSPALDAIEQFFWRDMCDNYFELVKDQFFNPQQYSEQEIAATKHTLYELGMRVLQLYAPYIPHITDAIYREMYREVYTTLSIHKTAFADVQTVYKAPESVVVVQHILAIVAQIRKLKSEKQLSLKTDIAELAITGPLAICEMLKKYEPVIKGITRALQITYQTNGEHNTLEQRADHWYAHIVVSL